MAIFNEILTGRINRSLQKLFAIKGSPPVRQLAGEVQPSHQLASGVENRYLEGWNRFFGGFNVAAVVAQNSVVHLRNPVGSNLMVVIEKLTVQVNPTGSVNLGFQSPGADATNSFVANRFDPRGNARQSLSISSGNNIIVFGNSTIIAAPPTSTPQDTIFTDDHEWPILPGDTWQLATGGLNTQLIIVLVWRERFLEESERS